MTMKQPAINAYIQALSNEPFWGATVPSYDAESRRLLDELFRELDQIRTMAENGAKSLWFTSERGEFEDFCDVDALIAEGEYKNIDEVRTAWQDEFPNEREWYSFVAVDLKDEHLAHFFIFQFTPL